MTTPQGKAPWFHQRMDTQPTMLAVLWETWANETLIWNRVVHTTGQRRLPRSAQPDAGASRPQYVVGLALQREASACSTAGCYDRHPVSRDVNSVNNNHRGLIQPLPRLFDHEYGA